MYKYWKIGTSAKGYVNAFENLIDTNYIDIGCKINLLMMDKLWIIVDSKGTKLREFTSGSTAKQYFYAWASMGFIKKQQNHFILATTLKNKEELIQFSKIFLIKESMDEKINRYRNTLIINSLFYKGIININDILKKGITKTKGDLSVKDITESISEYEKELIKDTLFVKKMKEKYDK